MLRHIENAQGPLEEERAYYSFQRRAWALFAPFYDAVVFPFAKLREEVAAMVDVPVSGRVLDVATGTGEQAFAFARRGRDVVGIDMSEAMLRIARRKNRYPNVTLELADASALPFVDGSFDASCVSFALHEMPETIRWRVLAEMMRVTKRNGAVVVVDYALPRGPVASWLAYHIIKVYEGHHYETFVNTDPNAMLTQLGVRVRERRSVLGGVGQIVIGERS